MQTEHQPLKPPDYLSPSSIDTFKQCPLKFKFSRIDRLIDPPTEATILGSFVHAVLEELYKLPSEDRSIASARSIMAEQWENGWGVQAAEILNKNRAAIHSFRWKSWWCIENYFNLENPKSIQPLGIEYELKSKIGEVPIRGYIDRWHLTEDGIVVTDYKTGKTPRHPYIEDKFFQLFLYADVLSSETGHPLEKVELLYLKDGVRLQKKVSAETEEAIESMRTSVSTTHVAIMERCERGSFEPTPNKLCDWCSYKPICPAWNKEK